jgi:ATP synthase protein I
MFRVIGLQVLATVVVALVAGWIGGWAAAISALAGGAACFVPNAVFALNLMLVRGKSGEVGVLAVFAGELVKVGLTIAVLALVAMLYRDVVWVAVIVALIAALKAQVLAWAWH